MDWKLTYQALAVFFCFISSILAIRRGLRLKKWRKMKGIVLGPETHLDTSAVRIEFIDPQGLKRVFVSNIQYGHYLRAKPEDRLPFKIGKEVSILVNPQNFAEAEISTSVYMWVGTILMIATLMMTFNLYRMNS